MSESDIIDEHKVKMLEIAVAALLLEHRNLNIQERRNKIHSLVLRPKFIEYYFKSSSIKNKNPKKRTKTKTKHPSHRQIIEYVDRLIQQKFYDAPPPIPVHAEPPYDFNEEIRKMRVAERASLAARAQREKEKKNDWWIHKHLQNHFEPEMIALVTINVIAVTVGVLVIRWLMDRFHFFDLF